MFSIFSLRRCGYIFLFLIFILLLVPQGGMDISVVENLLRNGGLEWI
jgi:hypothetical protein